MSSAVVESLFRLGFFAPPLAVVGCVPLLIAAGLIAGKSSGPHR
jgi:hypothetical protein